MENREEQIFSEIRAALSSIRMQFEELESKVSELHRIYGEGTGFEAPIDLDLDDEQFADGESSSPVSDAVIVHQVFAESDEDNLPEPVSEPFEEPLPELSEGHVDERAVESAAEFEPEVPAEVQVRPSAEIKTAGAEPVSRSSGREPIFEKAQSDSRLHKAVIDVMAEKQAWRTDFPGTPVKDIRSAISLNDRIIFINLLFAEDPMAFQQALTHINTLETLSQAIEYITVNYPQWDMNSELVYRFMMAVRRKVK